nr:DUF3768 domain-containing protein [uncultured Allomuricauda sp.]
MEDENKLVQQQNDTFRKNAFSAGLEGIKGKAVMTQGIAAMSYQDQLEIYKKVQDFNIFNENNDPYGEHDFGAFEYNGQKIFWKIDLYDTNYTYGSEQPHDLKQTRRVLTVMLASEY